MLAGVEKIADVVVVGVFDRDEGDFRIEALVLAFADANTEPFPDVARIGEHDEQIILASIDLEQRFAVFRPCFASQLSRMLQRKT